MNLTHKTILVNLEDWEFCKRQNINLSAEFRDYLRKRVILLSGDTDGLNTEILRQKAQKIKNQIYNLSTELKSIEKSISDNIKIAEEQKLRDLEEEQRKLDKLEKCINCGAGIKSKSHAFANGNVCNSCFMLCDGKQIAKWNEVKNEKQK